MPIEAFDVQLAEIRRAWSAIEATFKPNVITTLDAHEKHLHPQAIYQRIRCGTFDLA